MIAAIVLPRCYPEEILTGIRLTKRTVDALKPRATDFVEWDGELKGFGVRVRPSGTKSFIAQYRVGGRNTPVRKVTLGTYGKLTVEEAREAGRAVLARAELGQDVAAERAKLRADLTVSELCDLYLEEGCATKKPATVAGDAGRIRNHIKPLLGKKTASAVTGADVDALMRAVAQGRTAADRKIGPQSRSIVRGGRAAATQVVRTISTVFSFAVRRKLRPDNPALGVAKYAGNKKERFLTTDELEALGAAIREAETLGVPWDPADGGKAKHAPPAEKRRTRIAPHAAAALRLLLFTGARLREVLHLRWSEVDFERGLLLLPDSKTGRKTIILNAPALELLKQLPRVGIYVIAGETAGQKDEKPRSDLKRPWALVSRRAGLEGVRLHDLRHTHASFGAAAGLGLPVIGRLLGHTQAATTARYAHLADDPLRKASDRIAGDLARAIGESEPSGELVPMKVRRDV